MTPQAQRGEANQLCRPPDQSSLKAAAPWSSTLPRFELNGTREENWRSRMALNTEGFSFLMRDSGSEEVP